MKKKIKYDIEKNKKFLHDFLPSVIAAASLGILGNLLFRLSQDLHLTNFGNYCAIIVVICFAWLLAYGVLYLFHYLYVKKHEKEDSEVNHEDK